MVVFMSGQTETHSLGFRQWQTWLRAVGRQRVPGASSGRMVVQPPADLLVGGLNPSRAHMPAAPPMAVDWQGFEPPTEKNCNCLRYHLTVSCYDRSVHPHCLEPSDYKLLYIMRWGVLRE